MKLQTLLSVILLLFTSHFFGQNSVNQINAKDGVHYITTEIDYPITGTYFFEGAEPIVELKADGTGIYQLHEQPKKTMIWGIECDEKGNPKFIKGFDSAAYTIWYQYTSTTESDSDLAWKAVPFSVHFNTLKMYIQGERVKDYSETFEK